MMHSITRKRGIIWVKILLQIFKRKEKNHQFLSTIKKIEKICKKMKKQNKDYEKSDLIYFLYKISGLHVAQEKIWNQ